MEQNKEEAVGVPRLQFEAEDPQSDQVSQQPQNDVDDEDGWHDLTLKWETEQIKYLGVNITKDLSKIYNSVYGMFKMERITFIKRLQFDIFSEIWGKWKHYIQLRRPDLV
uniref:Uncharacterized protein n=1 Tax=Maylandia zebra TaxID=106582 RepID=A0A3P9DTM7_9CICH